MAEYGRVVCQVLVATEDGPDPDLEPDLVADPKLRVQFKPVASIHQPIDSDAYHIYQPVIGAFDADGNLVPRNHQPGDPKGILLPVGRWMVTFAGGRGLPDRFNSKPFPIDVTTAHTDFNPLDLRAEGPLVQTPTTQFVVNEAIYTESLAARDEALSARDQVLAALEAWEVPDIAGLAGAVEDIVVGLLVPGDNVTLTYDEVAGKITVGATGGGAEASLMIQDHIAHATPHPAYDVDIPRLDLILENGLI